MPAVLGRIRSLLFVPGHDTRKLTKGLECGADALIVDLEDSVPATEKERARETCAEFVASHRHRLPLFVRVNALSTGLLLADLATVVRAQPCGIILPKCATGGQAALVGHYLDALELRDGAAAGSVSVLPIVTETAAALFEMRSYSQDAGPRLCGMMWGGEDLSIDTGTSMNRAANGAYTPPFQLARSLCLFGAAAAGVAAVDAVYTDFRNIEGLREEAKEAVAAGFGAKAAIHPAQVAVINEVFPEAAAALREAEAIVEAFAKYPGAWTLDINGRSFDRAHLNGAERLLAALKAGGISR